MMMRLLQEILAEYSGNQDVAISSETKLMTELGLKSMDLVNIIGILEDRLDIEISDEHLRQFITVGDIVSFLEFSLQE